LAKGKRACLHGARERESARARRSRARDPLTGVCSEGERQTANARARGPARRTRKQGGKSESKRRFRQGGEGLKSREGEQRERGETRCASTHPLEKTHAPAARAPPTRRRRPRRRTTGPRPRPDCPPYRRSPTRLASSARCSRRALLSKLARRLLLPRVLGSCCAARREGGAGESSHATDSRVL
jgi:hypothetical protein